MSPRVPARLLAVAFLSACALPAFADPQLVSYTGVPRLIQNYPGAPKKLGSKSQLVVLMDDSGTKVLVELTRSSKFEFLADTDLLDKRKITVWGKPGADDVTPDATLKTLDVVSVEARQAGSQATLYATNGVLKDIMSGGEETGSKETFTLAAKSDGTGAKKTAVNLPGKAPAVGFGADLPADYPKEPVKDGNLLLGGPKPTCNAFGCSYDAPKGGLAPLTGPDAPHPKPLDKITGVVASYLGDDAKIPGSVGFTKLLVSDDGKGTILAAIRTPKPEQDSIFEDYEGGTLMTLHGDNTAQTITVNGQQVPIFDFASVEAKNTKTGKTVYVIGGQKGGNDETGDFYEDFTVTGDPAGNGATKVLRDRNGEVDLGGAAKHPVDSGELFPSKTPGVAGALGSSHP